MGVTQKKHVAYYRVSTTQQERSGLGLEAQQSTVESYCNGNIIASFTDIESGKRSNNRPNLLKAIALCKEQGATLVIAKLDRLSRNVEFIANLMNSKVNFVACDMPEADSFTIHIFAALAQKEREMISTRTKASLKALKDRGVKLGNPKHSNNNYKIAQLKDARGNRKKKEYNSTVLFIIRQLRQQNKSFEYIAVELNKQQFKTDRGNNYSPTQVFRIYKKIN